MAKLWDWVQKTAYAVAAACMAVTIALIFINVICRYITHYSIPWCEEVTRYMFIAVIFLTLNIMVSQGGALRIDIIDNYVKGSGAVILSLVQTALIVFALCVFTYSGISLMGVGRTSISPALHIPMIFVYSLMPLGYFLALVEVIRQEVIFLKGQKEQEGEQT